MTNLRRIILIFSILAITSLAFGLRLIASDRLYYDHDEDTYLAAALNYTNYLREAKYSWLAWDTTNFEHPSFYKIVYGVALLTQDPLAQFHKSDYSFNTPISNSQAYEYARTARSVSVVLGSLTVLALAIINPLAGFFLAINSLGIKYTSEVYLEALPMLTSFLSVIAFIRFVSVETSKKNNNKNSLLWLGLSALLLGITVASKYVYGVAGLAIVLYWLYLIIRGKISYRRLLLLVGWGMTSIFFFFVFNPYLWPHPLSRLLSTFTFHLNFQEEAFVKVYPFWQIVKWLFNPFREYNPNPSTAILFRIEPVIFILALIGLPKTIKDNFIYFVWFVLGFIFLLFWGTKWPQYALIILVPYSVIASQGALSIINLVSHKVFRKE